MDEYISIRNVLDIASQYCPDDDGSCSKADVDLREMLDKVKALPATDIQPVNQWISVKDRLPELEKDVLVWYRYTWGAGFTSYRFGISKWYSNIKRWYEGYLPKGIEVLYWQPLPEPPKEGDAE